MAFVKTNRFPLPTVTRADGTLGAYVQASPPTSGPNFIWPAQRVAIYQAQLKAAQAAQKKKKLFSLFNLFGASPSPAPCTIRKKGAVQTPAPKLRGLGTDGDTSTPGGFFPVPFGPPVPPDMVAQNGADLETIQATQGTTAAVAAKGYLNTVANSLANFLASKNQPKGNQPQQAPQSPLSGISGSTLAIGGAAVAALVLGLAAGGRKR